MILSRNLGDQISKPLCVILASFPFNIFVDQVNLAITISKASFFFLNVKFFICQSNLSNKSHATTILE
jgi:hypothetical protein